LFQKHDSFLLSCISVPPKSILIINSIGQKLKGLIGPYDEGSRLDLFCHSEGGRFDSNLNILMNQQKRSLLSAVII